MDVDDVLAANNGDTMIETSFFDDMGTERDSLRLGLKAEFDLTEAMTVTSVTGYRDVENKCRAGPDFRWRRYQDAGRRRWSAVHGTTVLRGAAYLLKGRVPDRRK